MTQIVDAWWNPASEPPGGFPPLPFDQYVPRAVRRGGMGIVYMCDTALKTHARLAVKVLNPTEAFASAQRSEFLRECHLWITLGEHRNVVAARTAHDWPGESPIVAVEFVRDSLRDVLNERPLSFGPAVLLWWDLTQGIRHARTRIPEFVHGDLKPENVMMTPEGVAKITDFGLAHSAWTGDVNVGTEDGSGVGTQQAAGTPLYMPPEQAAGHAQQASDVYAIACVVHESLTGKPVFGGARNAREAIRQHRLLPAPDLRASLPDVPKDFASLLRSCLAKRTDLRPSLDEIEAAITKIASDEAIALPESDEVTPVSPSSLIPVMHGLMNLRFFQDALRILGELETLTLTGDDQFEVQLHKARASREIGELGACAAALAQAELHVAGTNARIFRALLNVEKASFLAETSDFDEAVELLREADALHPMSVARMNMGTFLDRAGDLPGSIAALMSATELSDNLAVHHRIVLLLCVEQRSVEAVSWADRVVEAHRGNGTAHVARAYATLMYLGQYPEGPTGDLFDAAVKDATIARRADPSLPLLPIVETLLSSMSGGPVQTGEEG
jgi:serine/threonine protein kinase